MLSDTLTIQRFLHLVKRFVQGCASMVFPRMIYRYSGYINWRNTVIGCGRGVGPITISIRWMYHWYKRKIASSGRYPSFFPNPKASKAKPPDPNAIPQTPKTTHLLPPPVWWGGGRGVVRAFQSPQHPITGFQSPGPPMGNTKRSREPTAAWPVTPTTATPDPRRR